MPDHGDDQLPVSRLEDAVARGIITAEQLRAIRDMPAGEAAPPERRPEARRGLNAVTIAYYVGGAAVVFAFGWYIVDRWDKLGAGGVLVVSLLYAAIFALTARYLGRLGYRTAAAMVTLLAVAMAPLVAWALLKLTGLWYEPSRTRGAYALLAVDLLESLRWIPLELVTALAALVALRRVHFGILALPVAAALPVVAAQAMPLFMDPEITSEIAPWLNLVSAVVVIACGYWVDQHPRDDEDYARWVYLVGLVTLTVGVMGAWQSAGYERHGLPALAAGLFALSLFLRRPTVLVFGASAFVGYLAYLAFDVFRTALSFSVVLATFGLCVIVLTVWAQRRYPALARRVEERQAGLRAVPHAGLVFGGAVLVALTLYAVQLPAAHERVADRWAQTRLMALRMHRMRTQPPVHRTPPRPTPPPPTE